MKQQNFESALFPEPEPEKPIDAHARFAELRRSVLAGEPPPPEETYRLPKAPEASKASPEKRAKRKRPRSTSQPPFQPTPHAEHVRRWQDAQEAKED